MKINLKKAVATAAFSFLVIGLVGCNQEKSEPKAEAPKKTEIVQETTAFVEPVTGSLRAEVNEDAYFFEGEYFDIDSFDKITCTLEYSTGESLVIDKEQLSCDLMDTYLPAGDVILSISYEDKTVELPIYVEPYVEEVEEAVVYEAPVMTYDYLLTVPYYDQYALGLPSGCEGVSLAMCINYLGYGVNPYDICETYMPKDYNCTNPYVAFIGDPADDWSFGCAAPVLVQTINNYNAATGASLQAIDHTGDLDGVYNEIISGYPVAVCVSENWTEPFWFTDTLNGTDYFSWHANWHYVTVVGFNDFTVTVNDPIYGYHSVSRDTFEWIWWEMGAQAVAVH